MNNLQKTSAEIRRILPRLMELSLGCKVKSSQYPNLDFMIIRKDPHREYDNYLLIYNDGTIYQPRENLEIIGHSITKEDVEEAIGLFMQRCEMWNQEGEDNILQLNRIWGYGKPYHQQSSEVHNFVANIL